MSKIKDETGNIYGKLTVIQRMPSEKGRAMWLCKCKCGNITTKSGHDLRSGKIVGCGKCKNYIDEINHRYGKLLVIKKVGTSKDGIVWLCKCDCGNYTTATGHLLRSGDKQSCGCLNKVIEKPGTRYGKLTVIQEGGRDSQGCVKWICKCDCGNTIEVSGPHLRKKETTSCGCIKSKGEEMIKNILRELNITYISQLTIDDLQDKRLLYFDIAIPKNNNIILIEYDGEQHFYHIPAFGSKEKWEKQLIHDNMKNEYCKNNNYYHLYRISYKDNIKEKLYEILRFEKFDI